jgi:hypothetical protein
VKVSGTYAMAWGINVSGNLNWNDGATRVVTVNGPRTVYGGVTSTGATASKLSGATYNTLRFQADGSQRLAATKLLDLGAQKVFSFRGGKNRVKVMFDAFNVFNINTITSYSSNNSSASTFVNPSNIVPPRVFRIGAQVVF